ncbi:Uncharacterised protein [Mycolicibacterium vanbaalenii]|uniref:DNA topoisomerase IB N-terminal domain-containing protein n=1 Tax=Mycolicibacterium vanbaalenii TaxID=110539 RepID=A0A5S9RAI8_MYCVN|nr:hypothetical protein [Mycolicibacterium vanbaalenii]CAA0134136.1 Uncharacterised protein [Mycolicibacterium vanbaalenii]
MRLRRSALDRPGITRKRRGKGFAYYGTDGELLDDLDDEATLQRIKDLVIPPAWKKVWISPHPNGHIQAVGTDVAGRRQYLYHQAWQDERAEEKFDRVLEMSLELPQWRARIAGDLAAEAFVDADPPVSEKVVKRVEAAVMKEVADGLGNTPAVARGSYVDPRVVAGYERGYTIAAAARRAQRTRKPDEAQAILEKATRTLIRKVAKG